MLDEEEFARAAAPLCEELDGSEEDGWGVGEGAAEEHGGRAAIDEEDQYVSVISIGEIACGIARLAPGKRRRELEQWLGQTEQNFAEHLLPIDRDIAQRWGELTAKLAKAGRVLHPADGLIAATALHHGLQLMTRNTADFKHTGVLLFNPWVD